MMKAPTAPDPMKTAEAQSKMNKEAILESAKVNQMNQTTPWGTTSYTGEIGTPDRQQTVALDEQDQRALDTRRGIVQGVLDTGMNSLVPQVAEGFKNNAGLDFSNLPGRNSFNPGNLPGGGEFNYGGRRPGATNFGFNNLPGGGMFSFNKMPGGNEFSQGDLPGGQEFSFDKLPGGNKFSFDKLPGGQEFSFDNMPGGNKFSFDKLSNVRRFSTNGLPGGGEFRYSGLPELSSGKDLLTASEPVERATYDRAMNLLRPEIADKRRTLETSLINRGIPLDSPAAQRQLDRLDRTEGQQLENLSLSSILAGRNEQSRLFGNQLQARGQIAGEQMGEAQHNLGRRKALSDERARMQQLDQSLRSQLAGEQSQAAGINQRLRQLLGGEQSQEHGINQNLRQLLGGEQSQEHGINQNLRQLLGGEQTQEYGLNQELRKLLGTEKTQEAGINQNLRQILGGEQTKESDINHRLRQQLSGEQLSQFGANEQLRSSRNAEDANRFGLNQSLRQQLFGERANNYNMDQALRKQLISEGLMKRTQPINELAMLLGQAPALQMPQFPGVTQYQQQAPDYMGMVQSNYAQQANARAQQQAGMWSGLGSIAGGLFSLSDRRLKDDIKPIGKLDNGLTVYSYRFKGTSAYQIGLMADEVEMVRPEAVGEYDGFKTVNYAEAVK